MPSHGTTPLTDVTVESRSNDVVLARNRCDAVDPFGQCGTQVDGTGVQFGACRIEFTGSKQNGRGAIYVVDEGNNIKVAPPVNWRPCRARRLAAPGDPWLNSTRGVSLCCVSGVPRRTGAPSRPSMRAA